MPWNSHVSKTKNMHQEVVNTYETEMMLSDKVAFLSGLDYWMNPAEGADASISLNMGISVFIR